MRRLQFRPRVTALEPRWCPATIRPSFSNGSLAVTGTMLPADPQLLIARQPNGAFQVSLGTTTYGQYAVTGNLSVTLTGGGAAVELNATGGRIPGNVALDIGPLSNNYAYLSGGEIGGNVSLRGGAGLEAFSVGGFDPDTFAPVPVAVGGNLTVVSQPVGRPIEDFFFLDSGSVVAGNLTTSGVTYTYIFDPCRVGGGVTANATGSPGGFGIYNGGTVHGDFTVVGGATANGFLSLLTNDGRIDGRLTVAATAGFASLDTGGFLGTGSVGGDVRVTQSGTGLAALTVGDVGGGVTTNGGLVLVAGTVAGSLGCTGATQYVEIDGSVLGSVVVQSTVGGTFIVADTAVVGGRVSYTGSAAADSVSIAGVHAFALTVNTGGGNDTVSFAAGATVGSATIDFGTAPGTKLFDVTGVLGFPVVLRHYP